MKKKTKDIIPIGIILIVIIILIAVFYILSRIEIYNFTIVEINGNNIIAADIGSFTYSGLMINEINVKDENLNQINTSNIKEGDKIYFSDKEKGINYAYTVQKIENGNATVQMPEISYYSFTVEDTTIKSNERRNINISELKVGDTISVLNWGTKTTDSLAHFFEGHSIENLENVKRIKVIEKDTEEVDTIENRNKVAIKEAVVVKVNEDSIGVMGKESENDLYTVNYSSEGNIGFKQGQEVLIYFNGIIDNTSKKIENVGKIAIIKENSDIQITERALRTFSSSFDNVEIKVNELKNTGISFTIKDTNELPYSYADTYEIFKKNVKTTPEEERENYSSTSAANISWEEVQKVSDVASETTGIFESVDEDTIKKEYDWSNLYGQLGERRISISIKRR